MNFKEASIRRDNSEGLTNNWMRTNKSSLNKCVDFFFRAGASRNKDISKVFIDAYNENSDLALRILQWTRDIRGGAGERGTFRKLMVHLLGMDCTSHAKIVHKIPEIGRYDDLLNVGPINLVQVGIIKEALRKCDGLCAKWMPRKGEKADKIRSHMRLTPKEYRKLLVSLSKTVEQQMCAKDWSEINYSHVPSVASARYQKAFGRNDTTRYVEYLEALKRGDKDVKINAAAVFPHDIICASRNGNSEVADQQWKALPDYLNGAKMSLLPLIDVSGSMDVSLSGSSSKVKDASIALGIYCAERQSGPFKDLVMTFSGAARTVDLSSCKSLQEKISAVDDGNPCSTNLEAAFKKILEIAVEYKVAPMDMPENLLIISDMEFNNACNHTALSLCDALYAEAGYKRPNVVFWNMSARAGNSPVTFDQKGTALISGYSPAIMKSVVSCKVPTPENMMLEAVMVDRYKLG